MPMREIKFRAWHKTEKSFMYFELSELNDSMITKVEDGWYLEDCDLMQYTGLRDRLGRDIYEGDILLLTLGKHRLEVRWSLLGWRFFNLATQDWQFVYAADIKRLEVLGNRYEQPELLSIESEVA